ncbi:MAG: DUF202 domain-containing protein [Nocardioides sp.]
MVRLSASTDDHDDELVHRVAALERTALSWERTGIGVAAVGALVLHLRQESGPMLALGVLLITAAIVIVLVLAPARYRAARADVLGTRSVVQPWILLTLALLVAGVGVGLLVALLLRLVT